MKMIFRFLLTSLMVFHACAHAVATGNVSVTGNTDNAGDVDVYAYTLNTANGTDPALTGGQTRVMVRLSSANHSLQILTAYNATTQVETWSTLASGNGVPNAIFSSAGNTVYFRVINIAGTYDPSVTYTLHLSNPPHTSLGGGIVSNDGLVYTPWTFFGIEARTSITFSGNMVDQYGAAVPFSPQTLSVSHASAKIVRNIITNSSGYYSETVTFPRCTGGGMILGAASTTPVGTNYPPRSNYIYLYSDAGPWYSAWPMLDSAATLSNVFGMNPVGPKTGSANGAMGFNQDCN